jgi:hypothetical protein
LIEPAQNKFSPPWPTKRSLNKKPANIAPIDNKTKGINITNGDSCVSSIFTNLLLYLPWNVLKINLHEYIEVKNAVKIPIPAA